MAGIENLVGPSVLGKTGNVTVEEVCKNKKAIGLYFSAHWCPPCRGFTPQLIQYYEQIKESFEVIFISFDEDKESFEEYFSRMPWYALPFSSDKKETLGNLFGLNGIPVLVVLDANGDLITKEGRADVNRYLKSGDFPEEWYKQN